MKHFNEIYTKTNKRLKYTYFPYPFEYKLFYYLHIEPLYCTTEKETTITDLCNLELYKNALKNITKHFKFFLCFLTYTTNFIFLLYLVCGISRNKKMVFAPKYS